MRWQNSGVRRRENAKLCFLGGLAIKSESDCRRYSGALADQSGDCPELAGEPGFEPRQTESESVVLPLHHSPTVSEQIQPVSELSGSGGEARKQPGRYRPSTRYLPDLASAVSAACFAFERSWRVRNS